MIYGIGVDTATAARVAKSAQRASFAKKVFGAEERALFALKRDSAETMAANFAAKEAFGKALGTGIFSGDFALCEVQVLRNENGAPYLAFTGKAAELVKKKHLKVHLSLTHEAGLATAFVLLETADAAAP